MWNIFEPKNGSNGYYRIYHGAVCQVAELNVLSVENILAIECI